MGQYPTNLTDKQWQITENILDTNHRKRKYSLRDIMNAIMYLVKTGCQWRMLPKDFPPYNTVFYYLRISLARYHFPDSWYRVATSNNTAHFGVMVPVLGKRNERGWICSVSTVA